MRKYTILVACVVVAGCALHDPNDVAGRLNREFDKGEKLMNDCQQRQKNCAAYSKFKTDYEASINNYTTFESALAQHKARLAGGYQV